MALGSELFTLATSFDPYGAYKEGARAPAQEEIKDIATAEGLKDARAEQAQSLSQTAGGTQPLAGMAKSMLPPTYKLATDDGIPTAAGIFNQQAANSQQDITQSQKMMKQATMLRSMGDEKGYRETIDTARRLQTTAIQNMGNAKKEYQKSLDDGLESLYGANSQTEYNQRLQDALGRTGIPMPQGFPETWTPEVRSKLLSMMSPETRTKVEKEARAEKKAIDDSKHRDLQDQKLIAALQGGGKESPSASRVVQAFTQASDALTNVARLPITTTGPMFQQKQFNSLLTAPLSALNQEMSDTTSQKLQTRMTGVARSLASLESGGAATGLVGLANSIESGVSIPAGAKLDVAMDKLAEMRRIVESSSEAQLSDKNLSEDRKNLIRNKLELVRKAIPFTQEQLDAAASAAKDNPDLTFTEFASQKYGAQKTKGTGTKEDPIKLD
jgi:hypothetical protein